MVASPTSKPQAWPGRVGVLAALPSELGWLRAPAREDPAHIDSTPVDASNAFDERAGQPCPRGVSLSCHRVPGGGPELLAAVGGVGKVRAAMTASTLIERGARMLLVVGTCGALSARDLVGDLILADEAVQWDLSVRAGRRLAADTTLSQAWLQAAPRARHGVLLTADHPVLGHGARRRRRRHALRGLELPASSVLAAEMETAAVGAVATAHGIPWAALRVISDRPLRALERLTPGRSAQSSFSANFERVASLPAETLKRFPWKRFTN